MVPAGVLNSRASPRMSCGTPLHHDLAWGGTDVRAIQELGVWRSIKMVERYAHLSDEHKRAAIQGLSRGRMGTGFPTSENADKAESL